MTGLIRLLSRLLARMIRVFSQVEAHEIRATLVSMAMVFILLGSYYVLRPVRDSMASDWSDSEVAFLWNLNFFVSAGLVSLFGLAVCKFRLKQVIAGVYVIFAASFVLLYLGISAFESPPVEDSLGQGAVAQFEVSVEQNREAQVDSAGEQIAEARSERSPEQHADPQAESSADESGDQADEQSAEDVLFDKAFYLWVSVFALFNVSAFWTLMTDLFTKEQSKRLFAVVAAGGSAGTLLGPAIPTLFGDRLDQEMLILIASTGLLLVVPLIFYLYHLKRTVLGNVDVKGDTPALGGQWWQGFQTFATNPYMLGIAAFMLLYVFIGSFVYFEQKNLLAGFTRGERTQILGGIDWIVNALTFGLAFFATGRIVTRLGMPVALALMPLLVCIAMLVLAFAPIITVLLALQVLRRGGNYGLTRPAREMLFTKISPEDRFKSKPVIDIVVYRGGDAAAGSLFALLTDKIGLGLAAVAAIGSGIAALWAWVGVRLGRRFDEGESEPETVQESKQSEYT